MIYVFTGNGKGKTTAAIGTGIRAVGAGWKVLMVKFMKEKGVSSEDSLLERLENFDLYAFGRKGFYLPKEKLEENPELKKYFKPFEEIDYKKAKEGLTFSFKKSEHYDLIILDEICVAMDLGLLEPELVMENINKEKDYIFTGRNCPQFIIELADLVTEMKEIKHPFDKGVKAKKGLDF